MNLQLAPQEIKPYHAGANGPMADAQITQHNQITRQMNLIGKSGGSKKRKMKGGTQQILVPAPIPGSANPSQTQNIYTQLAKLHAGSVNNATYDNKIGGKKNKNKNKSRRKNKRNHKKFKKLKTTYKKIRY